MTHGTWKEGDCLGNATQVNRNAYTDKDRTKSDMKNNGQSRKGSRMERGDMFSYNASHSL